MAALAVAGVIALVALVAGSVLIPGLVLLLEADRAEGRR